MERYSASLVISGMQMATMSYHFILIRMAIKNHECRVGM